MREWQASPLGPPVGSGRPCRWALSSSGVLPQGFSQSQGQGDWGVRSPRGTVCQWGQIGQRQRGPPPPEVRPPRGDGTQAAGGGGGVGGPRGPALSPPSLASPSDVGRTGHVSFSCGCHTRSLRPPTSGCGLQSGRRRDVAFCFELSAPRGRERPQPGAPTHEQAAGVRARPRARPRCGRPSRSPLAHQAVRVAA